MKGSTDISTALSSVLAEKKERSKRQLNLILHNLEEASGDDAEARKLQDIKKTTDIFQYLGVKATVHGALRLGKRGNKTRLLRVTVNSDKEKAAILRYCTRLRGESIPSNFRKIYITPDLTPGGRSKILPLHNFSTTCFSILSISAQKQPSCKKGAAYAKKDSMKKL